MKTLIIEASIHDIPMAWELVETNESGERISSERGTYHPGKENTDEAGDAYDLDDLKGMADEVFECESIASRKKMRRIK